MKQEVAFRALRGRDEIRKQEREKAQLYRVYGIRTGRKNKGELFKNFIRSFDTYMEAKEFAAYISSLNSESRFAVVTLSTALEIICTEPVTHSFLNAAPAVAASIPATEPKEEALIKEIQSASPTSKDEITFLFTCLLGRNIEIDASCEDSIRLLYNLTAKITTTQVDEGYLEFSHKGKTFRLALTEVTK